MIWRMRSRLIVIDNVRKTSHKSGEETNREIRSHSPHEHGEYKLDDFPA